MCQCYTRLHMDWFDACACWASAGDAADAVGVDVRRHGLGQGEAVGYTLEGGRELDMNRWVARAQRNDFGAEPAAPTAARRGAIEVPYRLLFKRWAKFSISQF